MREFIWAGDDRLPDILSLWKQGFPDDGEEDVRTFLYTLKGEARCFMLLEENEARSMAFVIPAAMDGHMVWYVYAAATAAAFRGQGLFANLLGALVQRAEAQNVYGLFLRPATPSLFAYYARLGFVPMFYREEINCEVDKLYTKGDDWHWKEITQNVAARRNEWLERLGIPSVTWSEAATTYAVNLLESGGALASEHGFAMYRRATDGVEVTELVCETARRDEAVSSLSRHLACQINRVYRPAVTADNAAVYGMFRAVGTSDTVCGKWYMGFSLE